MYMHTLQCLLVLWQAGLPLVHAAPIRPDPIIIGDDNRIIYLVDEPAHRIAAIVLCISYAFLLALVQGYRAGRMAGCKTTTKVSDALVFIQGFFCIAALFSVAVNVSGLGLSTNEQCYAAIRICITMYTSSKIALALFLLERVRIVRAPFLPRSRDYVWIVGTIMTICGYGGILAFEYNAPRAALSLETGICTIGIQPGAAETLVVFDTALNITLTGVFVWQLRSSFGSLLNRIPSNSHNTVRQQKRSGCRLPDWEKHGLGSTGRSPSENNLRLMLMRNVIGCILLSINTIVNQATFLTRDFATMAHACLLMCLTDIVVGMLVTHWLSMRSAGVQHESASRPFNHQRGDSDISGGPGTRFWKSTKSSQALDLADHNVKKPAPISNVTYARDPHCVRISLR